MSSSEETLANGRSRVWGVGALCRAVADALAARFNPVEVQGEISGFARVASGHCYFVLKDESGQLKCAMFRRAAGLIDFQPHDGESVVVRGRLAVYEPRGDLQLVVESMSRAGPGALYEQFLKLKAKLETEGLFESSRKRPIPSYPSAIGLVTSLGGAALHDVLTLLRRRAPHIPVIIAAASVQGSGAAQELIRSIARLNEWALNQAARGGDARSSPEVVLLVRGGGSIDDLWAFNDEDLARAIAASALPVISGVGHETDFTIADFVADLRAPTPTAAAELAAQPLQGAWDGLVRAQQTLRRSLQFRLDRSAQALDLLASRLARPSTLVLNQRMMLYQRVRRLIDSMQGQARASRLQLEALKTKLRGVGASSLMRELERLERYRLRLDLMNPRQVLRRGYVWVHRSDGSAATQIADVRREMPLTLQFVDGQADVTVRELRQE